MIEIFRRDGVYLRGSTTNKKKGLFFSEPEEYHLHYILFFKNHDLNIINLYQGTVRGDFVGWMKVFTLWTELGHEMSKVNSYTVDKNKITYEKENRKVTLYISNDCQTLRYNSDYLVNNEVGSLTYIFFPFPPYFKTYLEKDYFL